MSGYICKKCVTFDAFFSKNMNENQDVQIIAVVILELMGS
jgi:hypothetical protein